MIYLETISRMRSCFPFARFTKMGATRQRSCWDKNRCRVTLDKGLKSLSKEITDNSKSHCSPHPSNPFNSQYSSSFGYPYGGWNFKNSVKFLQRNIPSKVFLRSLGKPSYKIEAEAGLRRGTWITYVVANCPCCPVVAGRFPWVANGNAETRVADGLIALEIIQLSFVPYTYERAAN